MKPLEEIIKQDFQGFKKKSLRQEDGGAVTPLWKGFKHDEKFYYRIAMGVGLSLASIQLGIGINFYAKSKTGEQSYAYSGKNVGNISIPNNWGMKIERIIKDSNRDYDTLIVAYLPRGKEYGENERRLLIRVEENQILEVGDWVEVRYEDMVKAEKYGYSQYDQGLRAWATLIPSEALFVTSRGNRSLSEIITSSTANSFQGQ